MAGAAPGPPTPDEGGPSASGEAAGPGLGDLIGPILAILVLAAVLRGFDLGSNPAAFHEDELAGAVSAWSIVTTGHDVERTVLPFLVTRLELKQPLYFYATVPFQAVLGHDAVAARIPALLFGVLSTALVGWLASRLSGRMAIGLAAGALFAVSPWAVHYGRIGWEPAAVLPFTIAGLGLLWIGLEAHRRPTVIAAAAILALGAYTYHPALLMHALLAGTAVLLQLGRLRRWDATALALGAGVAIVILVPYGLALGDPLFLERTRNISVFRDGVSLEGLDTAWRHYWATWNPAFLIGGETRNLRINPGPLVMLTTIPAIVAGLDGLAHRRRRADLFLLAWIVLGPLTAAITDDGAVPSAARAIFVLPPLMVVAGLGVVRIVEWVAGRVPRRRREPVARGLALAVALAVLIETYGWTDRYFNDYPVESAAAWDYGVSGAFAMAASDVPPGATLCIAENDISAWTYPQHVALYLPDPPFTLIEDVRDGRCRQPGSYVLALAERQLDGEVVEIGSVPDVFGDPEYRLVRVLGS